jgi:hypothetical protein
MSAWTSQQAGDWSRSSEHADSPWYDNDAQSALATVPGDGDTVEIEHDVVLDADATIGDGTDAGVVKNNATLTLNAKLTLNGDLVIGDVTERDYHGELSLGPGSELTDDSNSREVQLCSAILSSTATSGNWATVSGTLGILGLTTEGIASITRRFDLQYVAFTATGSLDFKPGNFGSVSSLVSFANCTFVGSNSVYFGNNNVMSPDVTLEIDSCDFRDTGNVTLGSQDSATRIPLFTNNTLSNCGEVRSYVSHTNWTGSVFHNTLCSSWDVNATTDNLFLAKDAGSGDAGIRLDQDGSLTNSYVRVKAPVINSHTVTSGGGGSLSFTDNIFEITTSEPNILFADDNRTLTVERNIVRGAGAFLNNVGAHSGATINANHNTVFLDYDTSSVHQGLWLSENGDLTSSEINFRSNLAGYATDIIRDALYWDNSSGDSQVIDLVDSNAYFNAAAAPFESGITVTTNNDFGVADPQFFDSSRNLATWGQIIHGTDGTDSAAIALFLSKNGYSSVTDTQSDTPSGVTVAELIEWVAEGFKVQNASLKDAGHDGVTIGAMDYISSHAGTADVEIGAASGVAAVEFAVTSFTASFAATVGGAVVNASAAYGLPGRSASSSASIGGVIVDATAAYGIPDRSASSALTVGAAEVAGVTDFTPPNFSGTSALDVGNIAFDATGAVAGVVRSATIAVTIGGASLASTAVYVALSDLILVADGEVTQLTQVAVSPDYAVNYEKVQVGNTVRSEVVFRDASNSDSLIDPAAVYLDVQDPNENEGTYQYGIDAAVKRDGLGQYYADVLLNKHGYWYFRWYTSGSRPASKEIVVNVWKWRRIDEV